MRRMQPYNRILTWLLALVLLLALAPMALAEGDEPPAEDPVPAEEPQEAPAPAEEPTEEPEQSAEGKADAETPVKDTPQPQAQPQGDKPLDLDFELLDPAQTETCRRVTEFLREQVGLNNAAIAGILANLHRESAFNYDKHGDYGNAYGLCQWRQFRLVQLEGYCLDMELDYETVEGQLFFLAYELKTYYPDLYEYVLLNAADDVGGAERVAYYFCSVYEGPADLERNLKERCELAVRLYYPQLLEAEAAAKKAAETPDPLPVQETR